MIPGEGSVALAFGADPSPLALRGPLRAVALIAAVVALVLLLGLVVALGPGLLGYRSIAVQSTGLQPAIPRGAMLVEQPVSPTALHPGDIVSFGSNENPGVIFTAQVMNWRIAPNSAAIELHTQPLGGGEERIWLVPPTEPVGRLVYWVPWAGAATDRLGARWFWLGLGIAGALLLWWSWRGTRRRGAPAKS